MKITNNLYYQVYNLKNLVLAWKKTRKGKTKKNHVMKFEKDLGKNLKQLQSELKNQTYSPKPLVKFILRDPKTRKISKSDFRDRIIHHALVNIIEPIFDERFIYDSCANRKYKGNLFAIERFEKFKREVTCNLKVETFCLKADIKHYFQEINHYTLLKIIKRRIKDEKVIWLIKQILASNVAQRKTEREPLQIMKKGMPLGNLTSQFFANVYLHELDFFIKHKLKAKHYLRYVDDFIILHHSKIQLEIFLKRINNFLTEKLKLELHPDKPKIIPLSRGIDFVGFRNFYRYKLLRKRNIRNIRNKITAFNSGLIDYEKFFEIFKGWQAYASWANTYNFTNKLLKGVKP